MNDPNNPCLFCKITKKDKLMENELAYASFDSFPVSNFHSLIILLTSNPTTTTYIFIRKTSKSINI